MFCPAGYQNAFSFTSYKDCICNRQSSPAFRHSVGANYREAYRGRSKAEFIAKTGDCLEELDESSYWFELLVESGIVPQEKLKNLIREANELTAIFVECHQSREEIYAIHEVYYDEGAEIWWFSVVDIVRVLTHQPDYQTARKYWNKLRQRLTREGSQSVTKCHRLKLPAADGKKYLTDVATAETLLRLIQSVPSPKAEPIKLWLAKVGYERMQDSSGVLATTRQKREVDPGENFLPPGSARAVGNLKKGVSSRGWNWQLKE